MRIAICDDETIILDEVSSYIKKYSKLASYDEDGMVNCKVYPDVAGDVQIKIADVLDLSGATKVKAFLWEDLDTLAPVCNHAEEELNITDIN